MEDAGPYYTDRGDPPEEDDESGAPHFEDNGSEAGGDGD